MKVKVKQGQNWYKGHEGFTYNVVDILGTPWYVINEGKKMHRGLLKSDCEIIEEPKEIPIKEFHNVQNPQHYHSGGIDPIGYAELNFPPEQLKGFYRINVLKYLSRYDQKNGIEDLEKADEYLKMLIDCERANREGRKENV